MSDRGGTHAFFHAVFHPEYRRTCKGCGYSWKVPRYFARVRPRTGLGVINRNAAMAENVAVFKSCAKCGSTRYTQERIWSEPSADS
jgi:predicted nucleic-acid-binding Zn-ribbon protein